MVNNEKEEVQKYQLWCNNEYWPPRCYRT